MKASIIIIVAVAVAVAVATLVSLVPTQTESQRYESQTLGLVRVIADRDGFMTLDGRRFVSYLALAEEMGGTTIVSHAHSQGDANLSWTEILEVYRNVD